MNATITHASFATVRQLFSFKRRGLSLKPFPGYSDDQWGIKAHNRPWVEERGQFRRGEKIVEVGGAYSLFPEYLAERYGTESWIIDDFGCYSNEIALWQRWGDPDKWIAEHPLVRYVKTPMGFFNPEIPDNYFDCVFTISTLEHVPKNLWSAIISDMLRVTKPGGRQLHSIDIPYYSTKDALLWLLISLVPGSAKVKAHQLAEWKGAFKKAGVDIAAKWPSVRYLFDRKLLIESADVVFRFYPPIEEEKEYPLGGYSLLIEIEKHG